MRRFFQRGDAVEVRWDDHCGSGGWSKDGHVGMNVSHIRSVGIFLRRTPHTTTIAQSIDDDTPESKSNERLTLGNSMITEIHRLRLGQTKKPSKKR